MNYFRIFAVLRSRTPLAAFNMFLLEFPRKIIPELEDIILQIIPKVFLGFLI